MPPRMNTKSTFCISFFKTFLALGISVKIPLKVFKLGNSINLIFGKVIFSWCASLYVLSILYTLVATTSSSTTLKYLKKGGRVTSAGAAIGTVLGIKPVLQIHGEKLDAFTKTRGVKQAKKKMIAAVRKELEERFPDGDFAKHAYLQSAYTKDKEAALKWKEELMAEFPEMEFHQDPLSLSVACHIGAGALAVAWTHKID